MKRVLYDTIIIASGARSGTSEFPNFSVRNQLKTMSWNSLKNWIYTLGYRFIFNFKLIYSQIIEYRTYSF